MTIAHTVLAAFLVAPFLLVQENQPGRSVVDAAATSGSVSPAAPLVGVVDLVKALEQYPKWIRSKGELQKLADQMEARVAEAGKAIDEQRAAHAILEKGSEESADANAQITLMEQQKRMLGERLRAKFELEHARRMIEIYEDFDVAVKKVAEERGVAIVLRVHDMGPATGAAARLAPKLVDDRINAFERRQVWFASAEVDLTPDLIKLLMVPLPETTGAKTAEKPVK